jgi:hypothetical protein
LYTQQLEEIMEQVDNFLNRIFGQKKIMAIPAKKEIIKNGVVSKYIRVLFYLGTKKQDYIAENVPGPMHPTQVQIRWEDPICCFL